MAFIDDTDKFQLWKYSISEFTIIYPENTYDVPIERLTEFTIQNDYEKNLFPIVKISVSLETSVYKQMIQNKNDIKIKLRLQKFYTQPGSEEKSLMRDCFNTTFSLILDDNFIDPDMGIRTSRDNNTEEKSSDINNIASPTSNNLQELFIYKDETINGMRTMINDVLNNVTMVGAISYIASKSGLKNILISPLENNVLYKELLIPPQTALSAIQYLDTEYGFYRKGSIIFFGIDRGYIINFKGGCTAFSKDEIRETCILVPERGGAYGNNEGSLEKRDQKTKRNYIVVKASNLKPENRSISNNVIDGNNATIINTNTNMVTNANTSTTQKGNGNTKMITTNSSNPWLADTYGAQKCADSTVITISSGDFDIDAISPNKKFTFLFENTRNGQDYFGNYIITSSIMKFTKNGSNLLLDATMVFKRAGGSVTISSDEL